MSENKDAMPSRRGFVKSAAFGGALAAQGGFPSIVSGAAIGDAIRVGLIGCGGRGTGAAAQAVRADDKAVLVAMADVTAEAVEDSLAILEERAPGKIQVPQEGRFVGLDAYQKLIESDVDVVLLATPPGFRPVQLRAAIEARKHVFCEKPIAVDAPGVRSVLESTAMAKAANVSLVSGFCWRYSNFIRETYSQIKQEGRIGRIVAHYATYYTSPVKPMPPETDRLPEWSDLEWQVRNWYNFTWLSGDSLVEQAVHSVDKLMWTMDDKPPLECVATGGRQVPALGGNIYDHFQINYEWPDGVRGFLGCRQMFHCYNENSDYIMGSEGVCTIGRGVFPVITGKNPWRFRGTKNDMYQQEHDELFASIRRGQPINDGEWMAHSTLAAIMGRMAAYTGRKITWEQALNSQEKLGPDHPTWDMSLPVAPLAIPGQTEFL